MEKKKECKYPTFAKRTKERAKEKGFTQEALAEKVNCSLPTIKKWYVGDACPDVHTLIELSKILDCNVGYLTGEIDQKTYDNKFICENTGLSENAVEYIRNLPEDQKNILDRLLSRQSGLSDILEELSLAHYYSCSDPEEASAADTDPGLIFALFDFTSDTASKEDKQRGIDNVRRAELVQMECKETIRAKVNDMLKNVPAPVPESYLDRMRFNIEYFKARKDFASNPIE